MQPQINGFYYDEEKRKYFRILPNGAGGGAGFYTSDRVKKRIKNDTDLEKVASVSPPLHWTRNSRRLCGAAQVYKSSILRVTHFTELSSTPRSRGSRRELEISAFVAGLRLRKTLWPSARTDIVGVTCMDIGKDDKRRDTLWVGSGQGIYKEYNVERCLREPSSNFDITTPFAELGGPITSITKTESFGVITAEAISPQDFNAMLWTPSSGSPGSTLYRIQRFRAGTDARCSAASGESSKMAIGGNRLLAYQVTNASNKLISTQRLCSDVFSLDLLQQHTFIAGLRDGSVRIYDTRMSNKSRSLPIAVSHTSTITKMKMVKDTYLLLAGLEDSLALYDLRFAKPQDPSRGNRMLKPEKSHAVMDYAGYTNEHVFNHGFDVSSDENMIAIADQSHTVKLYSIWTGALLPSPLSEHRFEIVPRAVKWSDAVLDHKCYNSLDSSPVPQGLLVTNGARLVYWSWNMKSGVN